MNNLSRGAELYGKIINGKGTYEDFMEYFGLFMTARPDSTISGEGMFDFFKNQWEEYVKRSR